MVDKIDNTNETEDTLKEKRIEIIRQQAKLIPGKPGDCDLCGEYSERLVEGACASCRDKYGLV